MTYDISTSHDTLWVNTATSCIGRFSKRFGIDVHRTVEDQMDGAPPCAFCTHGPAKKAEWKMFREAMLNFHSIDIPMNALVFD